ncbi:DeoR/GlpR transcriptional regulator [Pradoshia sp. D12]|uniref:DeoR/GlpR family DNA-binding transcription regulator n=1 Tax=Bacillaceae TaxID=186817 RepID=UPI00080AE968|nr:MULTISPECIES: DeoR/GlpR family DNA-binding transcription regulator [Bacillaceae]OCA86255.1 DeoR family transcriptional regulator [Bacillus sp. FJAT-27986]QFK72051.1 DeoR/GlpR transcriptional regulator [Pradoshia sp. D12]TPF71457.1 DeoR/GlpR transcriptional regulator [Bacillus sp. D12]
MLTSERQQYIIEKINQNGFIKIQELVKELHTSESTIRRDLSQLEDMSILKRVHGGAELVKKRSIEPTILEKSTSRTSEKEAIAKEAASIIDDGDCIYLDAGTTTLAMIPFIQNKPITVVTNGIMQAAALQESNIITYLIGGRIKKSTNAIIGSQAINNINNYRFDKVFLGINGIHPDWGFSTPDPEEAILKRSAIDLSKEAFILADFSKFDETSFARVAELNQATIITSGMDSAKLAKYKMNTKIKVVKS